MTREECEKKIIGQMKEIAAIYADYHGDADKLSMFVSHDFLSVNNRYWLPDEDKPINAHESEYGFFSDWGVQ